MTWEYTTIKLATTGFFGGNLDEHALNEMMNNLGQDGWELSAAFDTNAGAQTRDVVVIFKRPKA